MMRPSTRWCSDSPARPFRTAIVTVVTIIVTILGPAQGQAEPDQSASPGVDAPSPESARGLSEARQAYKLGEWERAERLYSEVLKQAPDLDAARVERGMALANLNRPLEAVGEFDRVLGPNPDPEDLAFFGRVLHGDDERGGPRSMSAAPYLNRALGLALAQGYSRSPDFNRALLVASVASEINRDDALYEAVETLQRLHPGQMKTHFYAGVAAVRRRDWVTAKKEVLRAGELGLPREQVESILSQGLESRATFRSYINYAISAGVAVALGLLGLFVAGKVLSSLTLRAAERGDPNIAITPGQRRLRQLYRVVINLAGLYYYICLPVVIALALLAVLALGYFVLSLPRIPAKALFLVFAFGCAMLMMIWSSIRSLFVRIKDEDPGRGLTVDEAPALWSLTREVAALGASKSSQAPQWRSLGNTVKMGAWSLASMDSPHLPPYPL